MEHLSAIVLHSVLLEIFSFTVTTLSACVCMSAAVELTSGIDDTPM